MCFTIAPPLWPYRSGAAAIEKNTNPGTVRLLCMAVVHISGELLKKTRLAVGCAVMLETQLHIRVAGCIMGGRVAQPCGTLYIRG